MNELSPFDLAILSVVTRLRLESCASGVVTSGDQSPSFLNLRLVFGPLFGVETRRGRHFREEMEKVTERAKTMDAREQKQVLSITHSQR